MQIRDKVIIITGASQGIGEATANFLAKQGAKLVLAARSVDKISQLANSLPGSLALVTDMRKSEDIKKLVEETIKKFERVDILINNAGQGLHTPVETINIKDFQDVMALNVYGPLLATQAVLPQMRKQGGGLIVNVSSGVTRGFFPGIAAYAATKYALNAISFTAAQEFAKDNIKVLVIRPKITSSNFYKNLVGGRPEEIQNRMKSGELPVDAPEYVAEKIGELITTEQPDMIL